MKLLKSLAVAAVVALPVLSFAQSNAPVTRAEVRQQLIDLQKAGYNPAADTTQYPQNIQAAEARISAGKAAAATSVGGSAAGSSAAGAPLAATRFDGSDVVGLGPIYAHP